MSKAGWACPDDRQLALRARLGAGWSVHTQSGAKRQKPEALTTSEQEAILAVIKKAEVLEQLEMQRIGRLVSRLETIRKHARGDGIGRCILCAEEFGFLSTAAAVCHDCRLSVCLKCAVAGSDPARRTPIWLCKLCSEHRELWKRSGAWFFRGLPNYVVPTSPVPSATSKVRSHPQVVNAAAESETESDDSDDPVSMNKPRYRKQKKHPKEQEFLRRDSVDSRTESQCHSSDIGGSEMSLGSSISRDDRGLLHVSLRYVDSPKQKMQLGVHECRDLPIVDRLTGTTDAYVKVYLKPDPDKSTKTKTFVHRKNLNPVFDEYFAFSVTSRDLLTKFLQVTVWHQNRTFGGRLIGGVALGKVVDNDECRDHWMKAVRYPNVKAEYWYALDPKVFEQDYE